ncbi:MAG: hypothetical protein KZQ83_19230 [gamma proteobacterium symbiont of Taylorina sp.]|nr:hypothetical protein [gamma proteobacterium symbiont of Taylorina sp.]
MKKLIMLLLMIIPCLVSAEQLISKAEADYIFSMNREDWEIHVREIRAPDGWNQSFNPIKSGTAIMSFNSNTGYGRSIKPFFNEVTQKPDMLIIGSYYSPDTLPENIEKLRNDASRQAIIELGEDYSTDVIISNTPPLKGVELHMTKKNINSLEVI